MSVFVYAGCSAAAVRLTEGTLVIDIVDKAKKELIWRGLGTGVVQNYSDHEKLQASIDEYVRKILNNFPPGHEHSKK